MITRFGEEWVKLSRTALKTIAWRGVIGSSLCSNLIHEQQNIKSLKD